MGAEQFRCRALAATAVLALTVLSLMATSRFSGGACPPCACGSELRSGGSAHRAAGGGCAECACDENHEDGVTSGDGVANGGSGRFRSEEGEGRKEVWEWVRHEDGADEANRRVHVFTVAWGYRTPLPYNICAYLLSVAHYNGGLPPQLYGVNPPQPVPRGDDTKIALTIRYLSSLPPRLFVVFTDATDVLANRPLDGLYPLFRSFRANVVVSAEAGCGPDIPQCHEWEKWAPPGTKQTHLNSGAIMGFAGAILELFTYAQELRTHALAYPVDVGGRKWVGKRWADQGWVMMAATTLRRKLSIVLDYESRLCVVMKGAPPFISNTPEGPDLELKTGVRPFFQHRNSLRFNKEAYASMINSISLFTSPAPPDLANAFDPASDRTLSDLCCTDAAQARWCRTT